MLARLIQWIFFLSICSSVHTMDKKKQKDIVHAKLCEKYEITETPKSYRTIVQPLPSDLKLHRSKMRANHMKDLHDLNQHQQVLNSYERTKDYTPENLSILKPGAQKAYRSIQETYRASKNILKKNSRMNAVMGDQNTQILITEKYINKLSQITNASEHIEKIKFHAYELFDFTTMLSDNNVPCALTNLHKNQLIKIRNTTNTTTAYLIQSTLCLQAINDQQKQIRYSILSSMTPENPETEAICQLLINYGDSTLSPQDVVKKFIEAINNCGNDTKQIIQTIKNYKNDTLSPQDIAEQLKKTVASQKKSADLITAIAETPLLSKVIQKLSSVTLESNDPLLPDFNYILAELYYKDKNYTQADSFYKKNKVAVLKEKKVQYHAFNASIAASQNFSKQDITYLSSLVGNVYNQLQKMNTTDPELSYKIGLLIYALANNNPKMDISEKINMLQDALRHIEHTQKDVATCLHIHTELSAIYANQSNYIAALAHTKHALQYREHAIAAILNDTENNSPDFYKQHAQLIHHIVDYIFTTNHATGITKNYTPPAEFASSDLCKQLLPYCEQLCQNNKNTSNEITRLITLSHVENNNNDKACEYIDTLPQPLSNADLLLKARIYLITDTILPEPELESIFKAFINNKKSSATDKEMILSLIEQSTTLFSTPSAEKQDLAIKLITKLSNISPTPPAAIQLAFDITRSFGGSHNEPEWRKKLNACTTFYANIGAPSEYDGNINLLTGLLLAQSGIVSTHRRVISYFTAALESKELSPESTQSARKGIAALYNEWATTIADHNTIIALLDKALEYDNSSELQFKKAMVILDHSDNQDLISEALQLLENIPQNSPVFSLSQIALVHAYCNYSVDTTRTPMLKTLIPLNINKAICCVQNDINNEQLLKTFVYICVKNCDAIDNQKEKDDYIKKALEYINILIDNNPNNIDYLSHRMELHAKLQQFGKALIDVDLMLNIQDLSNSRGITKEFLLLQKVELLLTENTDETIYNQVIECFEQLKARDEKNIIHFNQKFPLIQEHTKHLVKHNIITDKAIEWCCFAANSYVAADSANQLSTPPRQEEKDLAHYILSVAKTGNLDAQLIALPYLNAISCVSTTNLTEALRYSHQALFNPNNIKKRANVIYLIELLQTYLKDGIVLAYYILLDYYKEYPKEVEKMMLFLNQAKKQEHPEDDAADLIEAIFSSCKNILSESVNRCLDNPKTIKLTDAIAIFTIASMYQYSNIESILTAAVSYLNIAKTMLCEKYKLPQYRVPIQLSLGSVNYKLALINEEINYELLCQSADAGYLPAIYKLANIYIDQHRNDKHNIPVKTTDFMPLLSRDLEFPPTRALFQICQEILETKTQKQPNTTNHDNVIKTITNKVDFMMKSAHVTSLVKYPHYVEKNDTYKKALSCISNNKYKDAIPLLEQAAQKNHPSACILLALTYITDTIVAKDYNKAEASLKQALSYGLVGNKHTKLFDTISFLNTFTDFIKSLIEEEHPAENRSHLLSTSKNALISNGINTTAFYTLFKEINDINLPSIPEWVGKDTTNKSSINDLKKKWVKDHTNSNLSPIFREALNTKDISTKDDLITNAVQNNDPCALITVATNYLLGKDGTEKNVFLSLGGLQKALMHGFIEQKFCNNLFLIKLCQYIQNIVSISYTPDEIIYKKRFLRTIKQTLLKENIDVTDFYEIVLNNSKINLSVCPEWIEADSTEKEPFPLIKYPHHQETCTHYIEGLQAYGEKDYEKGLKLIQNAANTDEHPISCLFMSSYYCRGNMVEKDNNLAAMYLAKALAYGMIEQHFCTFQYLEVLCQYMHRLINEKPDIAPFLLKMIKDTLQKQNIDMPCFYAIYKECNKTDLSLAPEWVETNNKPSIDELKRKLVKDLANNNISDDYKKALAAVLQKDVAKSVVLMSIAAKNNDPCAGITMATNSLLAREGTEKDLYLALGGLQDTLMNGLLEQQFCNSLFLKKLCQFVQNVVSMPYKPDEIKFKRLLLLHIKQSLIKHNIDLMEFCDIVSHETQINLATCIDWLEADKNSQFTREELNAFMKESRQKENFTIDEFHTEIISQKNSLIQDPEYEESHAFLIAMETTQQGTIPSVRKGMELTKNVAEKEKHPQAYLILASEHLKGTVLPKNNKLSEQYLINALKYGVIQKQFSNHGFFKALCSYIYVMITDHPKNTRQKSFSIIKKAFKEKNIDLHLFEAEFEKEHKIKLSTVAEWK